MMRLGLELWDSPGLNAESDHTHHTTLALGSMDAALLVVRSDDLPTRSFLKLCDQVSASVQQRIVVITHFSPDSLDDPDDWEEEAEDVRVDARRITGATDAFIIDARNLFLLDGTALLHLLELTLQHHADRTLLCGIRTPGHWLRHRAARGDVLEAGLLDVDVSEALRPQLEQLTKTASAARLRMEHALLLAPMRAKELRDGRFAEARKEARQRQVQHWNQHWNATGHGFAAHVQNLPYRVRLALVFSGLVVTSYVLIGVVGYLGAAGLVASAYFDDLWVEVVNKGTLVAIAVLMAIWALPVGQAILVSLYMFGRNLSARLSDGAKACSLWLERRPDETPWLDYERARLSARYLLDLNIPVARPRPPEFHIDSRLPTASTSSTELQTFEHLASLKFLTPIVGLLALGAMAWWTSLGISALGLS
jgi:hypothetical protein